VRPPPRIGRGAAGRNARPPEVRRSERPTGWKPVLRVGPQIPLCVFRALRVPTPNAPSASFAFFAPSAFPSLTGWKPVPRGMHGALSRGCYPRFGAAWRWAVSGVDLSSSWPNARGTLGISRVPASIVRAMRGAGRGPARGAPRTKCRSSAAMSRASGPVCRSSGPVCRARGLFCRASSPMRCALGPLCHSSPPMRSKADVICRASGPMGRASGPLDDSPGPPERAPGPVCSARGPGCCSPGPICLAPGPAGFLSGPALPGPGLALPGSPRAAHPRGGCSHGCLS
jgi:hypothetical protein